MRKQTELDKQAAFERSYNAQQYEERTKRIIADAAAKPIRRQSYKPPQKKAVAATPKAVPRSIPSAPLPVPVRQNLRPARGYTYDSGPSPTPAPTSAPASSSDLGDVLVGAAIGYAAHAVIDAMMEDHDDSRSCSAPASEPSFESGGGGDFGGGGASGDD